MDIHTNCLKVQFGTGSRAPADKEIFAFFREREWAPDTLNAMFRAPREHCVYVKFRSEDAMQDALVKCPPSGEFRYENGESVKVTFATAKGNYRYVRIFGLPIEIDNKAVVNVLSRHGKIHSITRERYAPDTGYPILNGVRGIQMEISKDIPAQIHIHHFQVGVSYEGMPHRCFVCSAPDHVKADCPKRQKTENPDTGSPKRSTYAKVLTSGTKISGTSEDRAEDVAAVIEDESFKELPFGTEVEADTAGTEDEIEEESMDQSESSKAKKRGRGLRNNENITSGSDSSEPEKIKVPRAPSLLQAQVDYYKLRSSQKKT